MLNDVIKVVYTPPTSEKGETGRGQAEPAVLSFPGLKAGVSRTMDENVAHA